ncbi:MAG: hypothetical protein J6Q94_01195 [Clostridia bacterium]|nr:hypothetical protein [Clostridia bacterium]
MSIRLITMDGGHVTPEIDSFLYRALMPRIAPTGSEEDIPAFADYLLYGGNITPMGVNVFIQKTVMLGCGRIIEIPDSETIQAPSGTSGKTKNYILVFRIQPSASKSSDRVRALFVPENGTFYTDDISTGTGTYDVRFAAVTVDETGFVTYAKRILPKMPVFTKDASESKMETDGQICVPTAEGVRKFVREHNYFQKENFKDSLWLMQFLSKAIFSYVPAGEDDELDEAFGNEAEGAFVATFAGDEVSMQIAVPVAGADCPCIATRYGAGDTWSTWNTSGSGSTTVTEGEMLSADEYPVSNPYDGAESKQNLQAAITGGALFAIQTANNIPEVVTENSKLTITHKGMEKYIIREYEEYTEGIGTDLKAVVMPVEQGANLSILFVGEKQYATSRLGPIYVLNYDFEKKKSYAETTLNWSAKSTPSLTDEEKNAGVTALTYAMVTVPTSPDAEVPYNAIALIVKKDKDFDYSKSFYVSTNGLYPKMYNEVSGLTKKETTYPMKDSSARAITDRMYINDEGELFIDGKKIGNN